MYLNYKKVGMKNRLSILGLACILLGCGGSSGPNSAAPIDPGMGAGDVAPDLETDPNDSLVASFRLEADGPNGVETYELIRSVFGVDSLEAPDLYDAEVNHTGVAHIWEETDANIGHHFVFSSHRDEDWDRDRYPATQDRQRNEIKVYSGSDNGLKAFENDVMEYGWDFYVDEGMAVSKRFTHLAQLVAVLDDGSEPLTHLTAYENDGVDVVELRYENGGLEEVLDRYESWAAIHDEWLEVRARVHFSNQGSISFNVSRENGLPVLEVDRPSIDMWPVGAEYVRPKWGIYRSLDDAENLRSEEEIVRYANFFVDKYSN